jgi:chloramphenicol-sensitive protein RarD
MGSDREMAKGLAATVSAFAIWGVVPIYWKLVGAVPPGEMIGHRILWAIPFLALALWATGGFGGVRRAFRDRRVLGTLMMSAALVGANWFVFITAVAEDKVLEASLGYYINPLVNVVLGWCFLAERLRRVQWIAVGLAAAGVANLVIEVGELPWIALFLAFSFGLYGLVKKTARVEALPGLFAEAVLLAPLALILLATLGLHGTDRFFDVGPSVQLLVPVAGLLTAGPLFFFAYGARRLRLATVGLIQFLAPTGQFLLAVLVYGETFTAGHARTFVLIWAGVALYLVDLGKSSRARRRQVTPELG